MLKTARVGIRTTVSLLFSSPSTAFPDDLARSIHAAQEPSEVARQHHKRNRDRLNGEAVTRRNSSMAPPRSQVHEKHDPDQQAGSTPKDQMHQENALKPLPFELPLP